MKEEFLKRVIDWYLKSRDFNGLLLDGKASANERASAIELVREGQLQVVADGVDYPNPHIRPWASKRSIEEQVESIEALTPEGYGVCLYPTPAALKGVRVPQRFVNQPFRKAMAKGRGTLELAFFSVDVLEQYRNDPRYSFRYSDFGVFMSIGDAAYLDKEEPEKDKVSLGHIGFAYDLSKYDREDPNSPIVRRVAAFYGDLIELSPEHQKRWETYQVPDDNLKAHPAWWMSQMGHWPDGYGPFEKLFIELEQINELFENVWGEPLFKVSARPDDFGWILRPSQKEWDEFVFQLDKILSENIQQTALDKTGIARKNSQGQNLGTLARLEAFMKSTRVPTDIAHEILKPFLDVRTARQKPAHSLRANITDKTFVHRQITLLSEVNNSLDGLRHWLMSHPKNKDWKPKHEDIEQGYRM